MRLDNDKIACMNGWVGGARPRPAGTWPRPLREEAFHGLAGRIVRMIEPHSEADPAGLLVQFLVGFGNAVGRTPHFTVEGDRHYANTNAVLVGKTSKGRKGSAWSQIRRLLEKVDDTWATTRIVSGLSSGEGLIHAVRDPDNVAGDEEAPLERIDRRLLATETELGGTLQSLNRQGNTLSAVVRQAWDTGTLSTLTKNSPVHATDAHISILGHATSEDVRRHLLETDLANGFANRFLWVCVQRSKVLPEGGQMHMVDTSNLVQQIRAAVTKARQTGRVERDEAAASLWRSIYGPLSEGHAGMLGAVTNRAEAQTMRLALIYALLDQSQFIRLPHLKAALAVWNYCEASAAYVFGTALGDPIADRVLTELAVAPDGLTRTKIRDMFGRNQKADQLERALALLASHGLAHRAPPEETGGRPVERWLATTETTDRKASDEPLVA